MCARFLSAPFSKACRIANHRKELRDKSISENNAIFTFYYIGLQKMASFRLPASFAPRRGERQESRKQRRLVRRHNFVHAVWVRGEIGSGCA
ncbi:MAG: hypothetical protein EBU46_19060 [Nitrosomonadaceae bacterium]|nr:hypothetical protein [Nitrosomonadaceae bacterium]